MHHSSEWAYSYIYIYIYSCCLLLISFLKFSGCKLSFCFISQMIERAIQELGEKGGSTEESISRFLEKEYESLPWAHSMLLKHHLGKLCESGEIVVTRPKRYMLAGKNPCLNRSEKVNLDSSAKFKTKRQRTKWAWEWNDERVRKKKRKKHSTRKGNQKKDEKVKEVEKLQESGEKEEQELTGNGVHCEDDKQVKEDESKGSPSFAHGENSVSGYPSTSLTEQPEADEKKQSEVSPQQQEVGPSKIMILSSPERPPGFDTVEVKDISDLWSKKLELAPIEKFAESNRSQRPLRRSRRFTEPKGATLTSAELVTPITVEQMPSEKQQSKHLRRANYTKLKGDKKTGAKSKKSETTVIHVSTNSKERITELKNEHPLEFPPSAEHEPQQLLQDPPLNKEEVPQGKQLRRSLRIRLTKPEVAKDSNTLDLLQPQYCPEEGPRTFHRGKRKLDNQRPLEPIKAETDEHPKKRRLGRLVNCSSARIREGRMKSPEPEIVLALSIATAPLNKSKCQQTCEPHNHERRGRPARSRAC